MPKEIVELVGPFNYARLHDGECGWAVTDSNGNRAALVYDKGCAFAIAARLNGEHGLVPPLYGRSRE